MVKIGQASKDERGKFTGGKPGDQTGREVYVRDWYSYPWTHVIRPDSPVMAERQAVAMERACGNDLIGYSQGARNTLLAACRTLGYDPGQVKKASSTDCSALAALCAMYAGVPETMLFSGGNSVTSSTIRAALLRTRQYASLSSTLYILHPDRLMRGDILVAEGHHVAIVLSDGGTYPVLRPGSFGPEVRRLQGELNAKAGAMLDVDGEFGPLTAAAVERFQRARGLEVDRIAGPQTWRALREMKAA